MRSIYRRLYRRMWLIRGWYESRRCDGSRGYYGKPVLYLEDGQEKRGEIVSDRCGGFTVGKFRHSTVILREDGKIQTEGVFTTRVD